MRKLNNKKNLSISIVLLLVLIIGLGYAYLTSNLSISGTTEIANNSWDIHFENLNVTTGSVTATTPAAIDSNETSIEYAITLSRPKDFYEFAIDVVNDGTLPGKVSISTLSGLDTNSSKVIDYSIIYTNGNPVSIGDILNAGATKTIKVRVFYKDDISSTDLPSTNLHLDLTYTLQFLQSDKEEVITGTLLQNLKDNNSCITKYTGNVTDRVGVTEEATNVYFDKCEDKRNVIFGGFCWQVIRTTETGGLKVLFNGEPEGGKCESTRGEHQGIIGSDGTGITLGNNTIYGNSFSYNQTTGMFTLEDTFSATWSNSTYENLLNKFTCGNTTGVCNRLYFIRHYSSESTASLSFYTIGNTNYAQIGTSSFNTKSSSPASVGYMYNKMYFYGEKKDSSLDGTYLLGSTFTYDNETNTYTLSGTIKEINDWSTGYNTLNNTHYTCWNETGICDTISYINYTYYGSSSSKGTYYFNITGGKNINDILNEMLFDNEINKYDSNIKFIIDYWYSQNLLSSTSLLEDTVYCNDREINSLGQFNPNGGSTNTSLTFKSTSTDLTCNNITDQFAVSNNKAKLTYPIALLQEEENNAINTEPLMKTNEKWWGFSPISFYNDANVFGINTNGRTYSFSIYQSHGVRPVISLASFNTVSGGTGSETDPWIID